jgi:hypothetical protein
MRQQFKDLLAKNDKAFRKAQNPLSALFRKILFDMNVTPETGLRLMEEYIKKLVKADPKLDKSSERNNASQVLYSPEMTWKTFMKGLRFLSPIRVLFTVELWWKHLPHSTVHSVGLEFDGVSEDGTVHYQERGTNKPLVQSVTERVNELNNEELEEANRFLNELINNRKNSR